MAAQTGSAHSRTIRAAAQRAMSGQKADVEAYASAVTRPFVPAGPVSDLISQRLAVLQIRYLAGAAPTVSEDELCLALDHLADVIGLPAYGRTSHFEFRLFRMAILRNIPELNPAAMTEPEDMVDVNGKFGKAISSKMSPVEVAYLVGLLQLQKRVNPGFQLTEPELRAKYSKYESSMAAPPAKAISNQRFAISAFAANIDPVRSNAINGALRAFGKTTAAIANAVDLIAKELGYE